MMNISLNQLIKILILTLIFPLIFLNGWLAFQFFDYFKPIVTILILASLFAFILNYPVSILQQRKVKRNYAIGAVFIPVLLIVIVLSIILVPIVLDQFHEIVKLLPQWIDANEAKFQSLSDWTLSKRFRINTREILTQVNNH